MDEFAKLTQIFQTLSEYNRLNILKTIGDKECPVGEVVKATKLSQPLVSHHLKVLKENDFLDTKRTGPFIYYFVKDHKILQALDLFMDIFKNTEFTPRSEFRFCSPKMMHNYKHKHRR